MGTFLFDFCVNNFHCYLLCLMTYNFHFSFKPLFDELQQHDQCCGANSPLDYNSSWWFEEVSKKYEEEYETLINDTNSGWDYITKIPIPSYEPKQRYDDDTNTTSTTTHVVKGTTGINKDFKVEKEKGIDLLLIYIYIYIYMPR